MSDARRDLSEWTAFRDKRAEVQIRTATQQAWAAVDHRLTYKSNHEIPRELQRRFARLSAILELADDQFSQLRQEHDALEARYSESLRSGDLDITIDSASVDAYLDDSTNPVARLAATATTKGSIVRDVNDDPERAQRDRRGLLRVLGLLNVGTIGELDELLNDETAIQTALEGLHRGLNDADYKASGFPDDIAAMVLLALKNAPRDRVEKIYLEDYAAAIAAGYARE